MFQFKIHLFFVSLFLFATNVLADNSESLFQKISKDIADYKYKNKDIEQAKEIINLYNFIEHQNKLPSEKYIKKVIDQVKNSELFNDHLVWINFLYDIKKTTDSNLIKEKCIQSIPLLPSKIAFQKAIICIDRYIESYIENGKLGGINESDSFIKSNLKLILAKKNFTNLRHFLSLLKKQDKKSYLSFSQIIQNFYIKNNLHPSKRITQLLNPNEQFVTYLNTLKQPEVINNSYANFNRMIKKFDSQINDLNDEDLEKKTSELLDYYISNSLYRYFPKSLNIFQNLGKKLLYKEKYSLSENIFQKLVVLNYKSEKSANISMFNYLWNFIYQENYEKSSKIVFQYGLHSKFNSLPINLQFWVAYTLYKSDRVNLGKNFFEKIIKDAPLSFHAIIASKITNLQIINLKNIPSPASISNKEYNFTPSLTKTLHRLKIWTSIKASSFIESEISNLKKRDAKDFLTGVSQISDNEKILITAVIQMNIGDNLNSFNTIYSAINEKSLELNEVVLKTLFPREYEVSINEHSKKIDPSVIMSIIRQESAFNPNAMSAAGARGLMQVMPQTARMMSRGIKKTILHNPHTNIKIGTKYFQRLMTKYDGNIILALAAYNAGEGNLKKWMQQYLGKDSLLHMIESIPFSETRNYVRLIYRNIYFYKLLNIESKETETKDNFENIFGLNILGAIDTRNEKKQI